MYDFYKYIVWSSPAFLSGSTAAYYGLFGSIALICTGLIIYDIRYILNYEFYRKQSKKHLFELEYLILTTSKKHKLLDFKNNLNFEDLYIAAMKNATKRTLCYKNIATMKLNSTK